MNIEKKLIKTKTLLKPWLSFLELEPIRTYPNLNIPKYAQGWINELKDKNIEELVEFENNFTINTQDHDFSNFLKELSETISFPKPLVSKEDDIIIGLKQKKNHEIQRIREIIKDYNELNYVDIGSGVGHLSEALVKEQDSFSNCIDMDEYLQELGKKRLNEKGLLKKFKFIHANFKKDSQYQLITPYTKNMILGLHACGDLSSEIIEYFHKVQAQHLISIGCCYQRLNNRYNLSKLAQDSPLLFSTNALNLAARCYQFQSKDGLRQKIKIRRYRYALHLYQQSKGQSDFSSIGKTKLADYDDSFSAYVKKYANFTIGSSEEIESFFQNNLNEVEHIIFTDIFRLSLGRLIEVYLILDRAQYLVEHGHLVKVLEIFERKLSPRNLAIIV